MLGITGCMDLNLICGIACVHTIQNENSMGHFTFERGINVVILTKIRAPIQAVQIIYLLHEIQVIIYVQR